jgi:hypothetical protein
MKVLNVEVVTENGSAWKQIEIQRMVNAGYVGRDLDAVQAHVDELRKLGVPAPSRVPMIFPVLCDILTTNSHIDVIGDTTSGEAEFVLICDRDEIFVGVGSDHTDRDLEIYSLVNSKQICGNVLSDQVWPYAEVQSVWEDLILRSWVKQTPSSELVLYQEAALATIISPSDLMHLVKSQLTDSNMNGMAIFSGTVPLLTHETIYGAQFSAEMFDPHRGRELTCSYRVNQLDFLNE